MHLWSDYEGKTIAGDYELGELIRPEGRSAFFATSNGTGVAAVIRLTESLNDEGEMLERWRQVSAVGQANLVEIKKFGQTNFEGTPLAYALMERTDGSLAEILAERALSVAETHEVAESLVAALTALHEAGLVHEHVEAANVLAVGESIKLRSDCVRECILNPDDHAPAFCAELKARDVHDLALLLLRALTLEKKFTTMVRLPGPFDKIVANGVDGSWGLAEIDAALHPVAAKRLVPEVVMMAAAPTMTPRVAVPARPAAAAVVAVREKAEEAGVALPMRRVRNPLQPAPRSLGFWAACGVAGLVVIFLGWLLVRKPSSGAGAGQGGAVVSQAGATRIPTIDDAPGAGVAGAGGKESGVKAGMAKPSAITGGVIHTQVATAASQAGWHVVAFTYNREDQAWHKVATIREQHPGLSPEVFAPGGHAPYLVALGGAMSEREAVAMLSRARRDGMPRDTFLRRYGGR